MNVRELIFRLQQCDPDDLVVLSADAEGNTYSPLEDASTQMYVAESTWRGDIFERTLTPKMEAEGYSEDDLTDDPSAVPCVTLWPRNWESR